MKIVTWNVNSLKARIDRVEQWLIDNGPDVVLLQETKLADAAFPTERFGALGYESAHHGDGRWNGVAVLSRVGLTDVQRGFSNEADDETAERRLISADCAGVRFFSVYVPNGRVVGSEFYDAKLVFLAELRRELGLVGDAPLVIGGDFNVAPEDRDVWDIARFDGMTHVTEPERAAVRELIGLGLVDAMRSVHPETEGLFSWWDYRAGAFHKGWGMRIDLALVSGSLARRVTDAYVDREARKVLGELKPSDHVPVVVEIGD